MKFIVGIDLGGMSAKGGLFTEEGELIYTDRVKTCSNDGFEKTMTSLAELYRKMLTEKGVDEKDVLAIGVGAPGG